MYESGGKKKHVTFRLPHRKNERKKKKKKKKTTIEEEKAPPFGWHATLRDKMPEFIVTQRLKVTSYYFGHIVY